MLVQQLEGGDKASIAATEPMARFSSRMLTRGRRWLWAPLGRLGHNRHTHRVLHRLLQEGHGVSDADLFEGVTVHNKCCKVRTESVNLRGILS
eukprot:2432922-Amphidinium_carterae.1